jgi:translation initiation factor 2B subunit (eIF-2B alpha/beta/delta family)
MIFLTEKQNVLRIIAEISTRTLRTNDDQQRRSQECRALREALRQRTSELEEAAKLADVLYEACQQMGAVIDELKDRGTGGQQSESFEILLTKVLRQREGRGEERAQRDGSHNVDQEMTGIMAIGGGSASAEVGIHPVSS